MTTAASTVSAGLLSLPTTEADCEGFAAAVDDFLQARGSLIDRVLG